MATRSPEELKALTVVRTMLDGWHRLDLAAVLDCLAEGATIQSMMKEPVGGKADIEQFLAPFFRPGVTIEMEVVSEVVEGSTVVMERKDLMDIDGRKGELPATGVFLVKDGKIAVWREYFDLSSYARQFSPE